MEKLNYADSVQVGIAHVEGHANEDKFDRRACQCLNEGSGDRRHYLNALHRLSAAKSLMSWFKDHDLQAYKQWAYAAAKINRMLIQLEPWHRFQTHAHLYALLSDNEDLINWYKSHKVPFFIEDEANNKDDPRWVTFHSYQAILALNGERDLLAQRCEQILSQLAGEEEKYFLVDHRFYLALAKGDKPGMEAALNELTSPKVAKQRNYGVAFGLTENLIATHATIYAKMAWRHGYEVEVDSPWVPKEWLPIKPLNKYEDPWPFMQSFDLFQPFEGDWAAWSPTCTK